jgi:Fe-S cluster assembly ATP-binding protein
MMAIMGFSEYKITSGRIVFRGNDITEMDLTSRARIGIGIALQRPPALRGVPLRSILTYVRARAKQKEPAYEALLKEADMERFLERGVNDGLSGGEIRREELIQLCLMRPEFSMMDEPDSGVDLESLKTISNLINALLKCDTNRTAKRKSGLLITHTGTILETVFVDKAHVMVDGRVRCSGNPAVILERIRIEGYEACNRCREKEIEV